MSHESHPQNLAGNLGGFLNRFGNLHAAAFAAASRVNLRFNDYSASPGVKKILCRDLGLLAGLSHFPTRHRDTILFQDSFGLIFMNLHINS